MEKCRAEGCVAEAVERFTVCPSHLMEKYVEYRDGYMALQRKINKVGEILWGTK